MNTKLLPGVAAVALIAGCAVMPTPQEVDRATQEMMKSSFKDQGIAKVDRLNQDLGQKACSLPEEPPADVAKQIEAQALASRPASARLPRPPGPVAPRPWASSTSSQAPWSRHVAASSASGATSPSMLNTPSVAIIRVRQSCVSCKASSNAAMSLLG